MLRDRDIWFSVRDKIETELVSWSLTSLFSKSRPRPSHVSTRPRRLETTSRDRDYIPAMLIVDKHCSNVCFDEFSVPQTDRKSKQVNEQWTSKWTVIWKILFAISIGKDLLFSHQKYQNLWMNNKVTGDSKCNFCVFFHICRKFEFLISKGSVLTCLRWGK